MAIRCVVDNEREWENGIWTELEWEWERKTVEGENEERIIVVFASLARCQLNYVDI